MTKSRDRLEMPLRLLAAGVTVVSLGLLYSLPESLNVVNIPATVFLLVFTACTAFIHLARGLGAAVASALGVVIAVSIAIGLGVFLGGPSVAHATFTLFATAMLVLLGRIAAQASPPDQPVRTGFQHDAQNGVWRRPVGDLSAPESIEQTLGGVITDFCAWTGTEAARCAADGPLPGPAFARFVRQTLQERLGAADVRTYGVVDDPALHLRPLAPKTQDAKRAPAALVGPIGYALRTGHVWVRPRRDMSSNTSPWTWVLPIIEDGSPALLVTAAAIERATCDRPSVGHAVRDVLQLCWAHVRGLQALHTARRTDSQSGLLTRSELLKALAEPNGAAARTREPAACLALALEGLRRLDDRGQWAERDRLVQRLGVVLRERLHSDDLIARFADDRFVALMRRTDGTLGRQFAERLLNAVQREVVKHVDPDGLLGVGVRGALASVDFDADGHDRLLPRSLRLLDEARAQGRPFLTEEPSSEWTLDARTTDDQKQQ